MKLVAKKYLINLIWALLSVMVVTVLIYRDEPTPFSFGLAAAIAAGITFAERRNQDKMKKAQNDGSEDAPVQAGE